MKLASVAPLLLVASSAFAMPKYTRTSGSEVIRARQAKVHRDLVDVCASVDADLKLTTIPGLGPVIIGHLDICLCLSVLPSFCQEHPVTKAASALIGLDAVVNIVAGLLHDQNNKQTCTLPEHGHSICSHDNPCGFGCGDGYEPYTPSGSLYPTKCYCPPPSTECNGKCGSFPHGCGSAVPAPHRRAARRETTCAPGETMCGVHGSSGWECIDTLANKQSCGGCMAPSPFSSGYSKEGTDCTAIPYVKDGDVECRSGRCIVHTCKDGFAPSASHDACVRVFNAEAKRATATAA